MDDTIKDIYRNMLCGGRMKPVLQQDYANLTIINAPGSIIWEHRYVLDRHLNKIHFLGTLPYYVHEM